MCVCERERERESERERKRESEITKTGKVRAGSRAPASRSSADHFTEMCSGSEAGSYLRLIDLCITQLQAQEE